MDFNLWIVNFRQTTSETDAHSVHSRFQHGQISHSFPQNTLLTDFWIEN